MMYNTPQRIFTRKNLLYGLENNMKHRKRLLALLLSGAMALSLAACGHSDSAESPSAEPSEEVSTAPEASATPAIEADLSQTALQFAAGLSPTDVMLTVNGDSVNADLFCYLLGQACGQTQQYMSYFGMNLSDMPDMAADLLEQGVSLSIYHTIIRQKAAELGCLLTDGQAAEVKTAMDGADLERSAPLWDLTDEGAQFIFEMNPYYENLMNAVTHEPSAQELDEYVESRGVFAVKHILLSTVDQTTQEPLSDEEIAGKKAKAEDLLAQLQAADDMPAKFDDLMNANSEDSGLQSNPDGYVFNEDDSLVGGFREAALALKEGELSGIVETDYGYHIMLRLPLTDETKAGYGDEFRMDALEAQMDQWIEAAEVTRADALGTLNAVEFYTRLAAYQQALYEQQNPPESAPVESGGVG